MKISGIVIIILGCYCIAFGGETCTITGDVSFQHQGDIYVCICSLEEWAEFQRPGHELSDPPCKLITMNSEIEMAGKAAFKLDGVPKGTYVIIGYQDLNKNGKVDFENYIMNEPWGTYKDSGPITNNPSWDVIKFKLEKDIDGIKIQM